MQQVTVLPMKVTQNVEIKDDLIDATPASSNDDFSQHIDLHLSEKKEITGSKDNSSDRHAETKVASKTIEKDKRETDTQIENESESSQVLTEEVNSTVNEQELAADGKKNEIQPIENDVVDTEEAVDESDLLMSFLTRVDKTLIDKPLLNEVSNTTKEEVVLLDKNNPTTHLLNADEEIMSEGDSLSEDSAEYEKKSNSLIAATKSNKENVSNEQVDTKQLIDGDNLIDKKLANTNSDKINDGINIKGANLVALAENDTSNNKKAIEVNELSQIKNTESLVNTVSEKKEVKKANIDNQSKNTQVNITPESKEVTKTDVDSQNKNIQQEFKSIAENSHSGDVESLKKSPIETQTNINTTSVLERVSKIDEQATKLVENESNATKSASNISINATATNQSSVGQNLASQTATKTTAANVTEQTNSESEVSETESDLTLNTELEEQFITQNTKLTTDHKPADTTVKPIVNTAPSLAASHFIGESERVAEATYDRIDQQSADVLKLAGSTEVSQSQKTNTQLHQETISIFRKDFSDAVKDKVMLVISQKLQQFDIVLDPPELGNMQVRVNLQGEQATVNFVVQNQQAKEALEQNMHKLRDSLAEQGVDVGGANVEQQSQQSDTDENNGYRANNFSTNTADASDVIEHDLSRVMNNVSAKGVDYYA